MNQQMDVKKTAQVMNEFARQAEMSAAKVRPLCGLGWVVYDLSRAGAGCVGWL